MRSNDVLATVSAIRHGLGIGRVPGFVGDAIPGLMHFKDIPVLPRQSLWLLTHPDMRKVSRMRVFNAFLTENIIDILA
ncbi:MAG: substrate-binding domain-containing protein [Candidatus Thiodiazotropha sp. (ex Dulcina madagascariensis)]|nr:substrate-binding domain-containing protein [Candidatus Thiodiazotropha sp. (ex Dulcina madagascariensis)]